MATRQKRNSSLGRLFIPTLTLILLTYFSYHAFQGRYGVHSARALDEKSVALQFELARLKIERKERAARVALLRDGSMERDMVDEKARYYLNMAREDEIVIFRSAAR